MFQTSLRQLDLSSEWVDFQVQNGEFPERPEAFDYYLCCGSANSVYDGAPWIEHLIEFVRRVDETKSRMVGICFGHQLIAQALGGRVEQAEQGWGLGNQSGETLFIPSWMRSAKNGVNMLYSHQDQVVKLPDNARLLMHTEHCPNAAFLITDRFLTFQGHPEFTPGYLDALMESRRDRIGSETVDRAKRTLSKGLHLHNRQVMGWIADFLQAS